MPPIRILHTLEPDHGWFFTSPDVPGLSGSETSYRAAHARAEEVVRWYLASDGRTNGTPVEFVHFVPEAQAAAIAA